MNFILEKSFTHSTDVHSYYENGNKYISTYKSQCFKEVYDFCWAALIAVLNRMRPAGHGLDSTDLELPYSMYIFNISVRSFYLSWKLFQWKRGNDTISLHSDSWALRWENPWRSMVNEASESNSWDMSLNPA